MTFIPPPKVTSRSLSWLSMVEKAWGPEFTKPDRGYEFRNRNFDNSDRTRGGVYGVSAPSMFLIDGLQYPDMRDGVQADVGTDHGAANNGYGAYQEIDIDPAP